MAALLAMINVKNMSNSINSNFIPLITTDQVTLVPQQIASTIPPPPTPAINPPKESKRVVIAPAVCWCQQMLRYVLAIWNYDNVLIE